MELKFTPWRVAAFCLLVTAYAIHGGFVIPPDLSYYMIRSWLTALLLFLVSAATATLVDHWIGRVDRSNLRWFYIVLGVAGMTGSMILLHLFRERLAMV